MKEIKEGCRVIVSVYKGDIYIRSYNATVKGFTPGGLVKVAPAGMLALNACQPTMSRLLAVQPFNCYCGLLA